MHLTIHPRLIVSTNIAKAPGHSKYPVAELTIDLEGIVGDKHRGIGNRQISILSQESLDKFNVHKKTSIGPGELGENLTIAGINLLQASILDRLHIGEVVLEITQLGKKCHGDVCEIFRQVGQCAMFDGSAFARVIHGGIIKPEDPIEYFPKTMRILIVTLSDRAVQGVYEDRSGPIAKELIDKFFLTAKWQNFSIQNVLLADDAEQLTQILQQAITDKVDFVFTLGGTGIGPRDITTDVVLQLADKVIPGIMEYVRVKYGAIKPAALLSRSVAAVTQHTQIYAIPGSPRAVTEYLTEILPILEHSIYMLHGIDMH